MNAQLTVVLTVLGGMLIYPCADCTARVDTAVQDRFEAHYEDKVFFLREDLRTFDVSDDDAVFITDLDGFIYEDRLAGETGRIVFSRGSEVIIDKIDFDVKKIEIEFHTVSGARSGSVVFEFRDRLSSSFDESDVFVTRFDEIFLKESLKKFPVYSDRTDRIQRLIEKKALAIGISRDEVLLTLGTPFDIVKHVRQDNATQEVWIYKEALRTYMLTIEDDTLKEWTEY